MAKRNDRESESQRTRVDIALKEVYRHWKSGELIAAKGMRN